jgi:DNA invertase Pin-like site-specific DNA recombinase
VPQSDISAKGPTVTIERDAPIPGRRPWRKAARDLLGRRSAPAAPAVHAPATPTDDGQDAIGYVLRPRDGTAEQFAAQLEEVAAWCAAAGVNLKDIVHDVAAPREHRARPALQWALSEIAERRADTLVVLQLGDLSASLVTLSPLLRWFMDGGRVLVAVDVGIDTSTPEGRLATEALAGVGSIERERISVGTRHGMAAARARGQRQGPIAVADVPELHARIARMREDGMTLQAIADVLNDEGVPTLRGGAKWRPSSVQRAAGYRRPSTYGGLSLPRST